MTPEQVEFTAEATHLAARRSRALWWVLAAVAMLVAVGLVVGFARPGFIAGALAFMRAGAESANNLLLAPLQRIAARAAG